MLAFQICRQTIISYRDKSRIFVRRGAPLRNDVTIQDLGGRGGMRTPCILPIDPPLS